MFETNKIFV